MVKLCEHKGSLCRLCLRKVGGRESRDFRGKDVEHPNKFTGIDVL